jgi:hypothetical protein
MSQFNRYRGDDKDPEDGLPVAAFIIMALAVLALYLFNQQ